MATDDRCAVQGLGSDPISEEGSGEGSLLSSAPLPYPMPSEEHLTAEGQGMVFPVAAAILDCVYRPCVFRGCVWKWVTVK